VPELVVTVELIIAVVLVVAVGFVVIVELVVTVELVVVVGLGGLMVVLVSVGVTGPVTIQEQAEDMRDGIL
jgi:hypothetical protein